MRIFIDTNVFLEYLCARNRATEVQSLLDAIDDGGHQAYMSSSCFCNIAYYVELALKERGVHKPEKTVKTREILNTVLEIANITDISHESALDAINDLRFSDFEDSMQYRSAIDARCDVLVTFNIKDFKNVLNDSILVLTPAQAVNRFGDKLTP